MPPAGETTWMAGMFQISPGRLGQLLFLFRHFLPFILDAPEDGFRGVLGQVLTARVTSRDLGDQSVPAHTTIMYLLTVLASSFTAL